MLKTAAYLSLLTIAASSLSCRTVSDFELVDCTEDKHCSSGQQCVDESCEWVSTPSQPAETNSNPGPGPSCGDEVSCDACIQCSNANVCASKRLECELREDCQALQTCVQSCSLDDALCITSCRDSYTEALPYYQGWLNCIFCDSCMAHCGTQDNCS